MGDPLRRPSIPDVSRAIRQLVPFPAAPPAPAALTEADVRRVIREELQDDARRREADEHRRSVELFRRLPERPTPDEIRRAMGLSLQVGGLDDG